jgi:hypothetical protein
VNFYPSLVPPRDSSFIWATLADTMGTSGRTNIVIQSTSSLSPDTISVAFQVVDSMAFDVSPHFVDFGNIPVGRASRRIIRVLKNDGLPFEYDELDREIESGTNASIELRDGGLPQILRNWVSWYDTLKMTWTPPVGVRSDTIFYKRMVWGLIAGCDTIVLRSNMLPDMAGGSVIYPCQPNPCNGISRIICDLATWEDWKVELFDALARRVRVLWNGYLGQGRHTFILDASKLSSGIYFCRLSALNFSSSIKIAVVK